MIGFRVSSLSRTLRSRRSFMEKRRASTPRLAPGEKEREKCIEAKRRERVCVRVGERGQRRGWGGQKGTESVRKSDASNTLATR